MLVEKKLTAKNSSQAGNPSSINLSIFLTINNGNIKILGVRNKNEKTPKSTICPILCRITQKKLSPI
jgi:hypothetical protein